LKAFSHILHKHLVQMRLRRTWARFASVLLTYFVCKSLPSAGGFNKERDCHPPQWSLSPSTYTALRGGDISFSVKGYHSNHGRAFESWHIPFV